MRQLLFLPVFLFLSAAPAPPPPTIDFFQLPTIIHAQIWGSEVFLIHEDRSSTLVSMSEIELVQPVSVNAYGYPTVTLPTSFLQNPNVIQTEYNSKVGTHKVMTNCKGMSEKRCAEKHKKQLDALQTIFPKV